MAKRKKKSDEQPLFIHYANAEFKKKEILNVIGMINNYFPPDIVV
jgi:hypothetical protein